MKHESALIAILGFLMTASAPAEESTAPSAEAAAAPKSGLVIHEIGFLFESGISENEVSVQDLLGDLPSHVRSESKETPRDAVTDTPGSEFGEGFGTGFDVPGIPTTTTADPLIFFHADREYTVDVTVEFPDGRPIAWFPRTDEYWMQKLIWKEVKISPQMPKGRNIKPFRDEGDKTKWQGLAAARKIPGVAYVECGTQVEKYLFYEAAVRYPTTLLYAGDPLGARQPAGALTLENIRNFVCHDLYVFPGAREQSRGIAYIRELKAGQRIDLGAATSEAANANPELEIEWLSPETVRAHIEARVIELGLTAEEAALLYDTTLESGFNRSPARRALYRLPDDEYARIYPLAFSPAPTELVRVGLVLVPELATRSLEHMVNTAALGKPMERSRARGALCNLGDRGVNPLIEMRQRAKGPTLRNIDRAIEAIQAAVLESANTPAIR